MKRAWNILFFAFFIFCLFLFKPRQDVIFTAINETQYIRLFETGHDFELCVEENNIFTGTYVLTKDTVFLKYRENRSPYQESWLSKQSASPRALPKKLYINNSASRINSTDIQSFSAQIHSDKRDKLIGNSVANILAATPPEK